MLLSVKDRAIGELTIKVTGMAPEKLLNIAVNNHLKLRRIRRESYTVLYAIISIRDYHILMKKLPEGKYKVECIRSRGVLPNLTGLKKRYTLIAGVAVCILVSFFASFRVWNITIKGCENIDPQTVLERLNTYGIKRGMAKDGGFFDECEKKLVKDLPDISWVSLSVTGVSLKVDINEKPRLPALTPKNTPADILAAKDGVVLSVTVLQGQAVVQEGQIVNKGDVLITGQLTFSGAPYQYISANGSVKARVWYSSSMEVPLYEMVKLRTGKKTVVRYMEMLGMRIHIEGENSFLSSECEEASREVMQMGLPVRLVTLTYYETQDLRIDLSQDEASLKAERIMMDQLSAELPDEAQLIERNVTRKQSEDKNTLKVNLYIETLEEIGVYTELLNNR